MPNLPVREIVLYKHGVGFFVRAGELSGQEIALTFSKDEINDVLKSLAVFDRAGGQVLGIHYDTPMDKQARLANTSIRLSETASLKDLITDLRGRQVTVTLEPVPGTYETMTGRVIGIDKPPKPDRDFTLNTSDPVTSTLVTMLAVDGQVRIFRLDMLRSFLIHDEQSDHDLSYFLDSSMSEDSRRTVKVRLTEGDHDLILYYVAPSPTWRVSYRLVAESDPESPEKGKALLQGWGLFDNRLEEDLDEVRVTLVAGQPISFIYDLYASRIPVRPTVQDETRVAPGPIEYAGTVYEEAPIAMMQDAGMRLSKRAQPAMPQAAPEMLSIANFAPADLRQSTPAQAETRESGEFFQYEVTTPVTVKRGESALVPIISAEINYQRELLYNKAKLPDHPVAAIRFNNTTTLTLERGPVTLVEDGEYKGEAVVTFTKDNNQVYLPYAVELGVKVTERPKQYTQTSGLSIDGDYLVFEEYYVEQITAIFENSTAKNLTVTLETPVVTGLELFETSKPMIETATERRWRVEVPSRGKAEFTRKDRRLVKRHEALRNLQYQNLQHYLENRWLDKSTFERLKEILDNLGLMQRANEKIAEFEAERKKIYGQQEQLRANLGALQSTGQEATLRNRLLGQLEQTQNRLEEIEKQTGDLQKMITATEDKIRQLIENLGKQEAPPEVPILEPVPVQAMDDKVLPPDDDINEGTATSATEADK